MKLECAPNDIKSGDGTIWLIVIGHTKTPDTPQVHAMCWQWPTPNKLIITAMAGPVLSLVYLKTGNVLM
jgi:hypothetical protein